MHINKNLNVVVPLSRDDGSTLYAHAAPISYEVFETYHLVLAKTWASFVANGLDPRSAPSVAALTLKEVAKATPRGPNLSWYDGPDGVGGERGLLAEIRRLCSVLVPGADGWTPTLLDVATQTGQVSQEERRELVNLLTFFTVSWHVPASGDRLNLIQGMAVMYDSLTTSLDCMNYAASLKTLTPAEPTGRRVRA